MLTEKIIPLIADKIRWQQVLSQAVTDPAELIALFPYLKNQLSSLQTASREFKLLIPRPYLAKVNPNNPNDPLLKQVLPDAAELITTPGFSNDPLQESQANPIPGLLHKYPSRVLLTLTNACAINCRYCFRRHFPYQTNRLDLDKVIAYLKAHPEINEVILSGGDPLIAKDHYLARLSNALDDLPHIKRLRIHSRLPVMIPSRLNKELLNWFVHPTRQSLLVLHCNHPNELDKKLQSALQPLQQAGIILLNQSVLLKGVNDSSKTLAALSEKLFESHIMPYYLHLLDKVNGAAHFEVPLTKAKKIYQALQQTLPGFLVPRLVREEPDKLHKTFV